MMKKVWSILLISTLMLLTILSLSGCGLGIIGPKFEIGSSAVHSRAEIRAAMKVVQEQMAEGGSWTLTRIWYDEEVSEDQYHAQKIKDQRGAEAAIILLCDFKTGPNVEGSFSPNKEYTRYTWTLCRYGGTWVIERGGYA